MRINVAIPEAHVRKPVLDAALETVTRLNEDLIRSGVSPTSDQLISAGARWKPEPPGDEHFDHGGILRSRGHGDCDDWAPLHAATLRVTGEDRGARAVVRKSGPKRWHALVQRSDGTIDDPSLSAGMPGPGGSVGVRGASLPLMHRPRAMHTSVSGAFIATPHLALRPLADRHGQIEAWQARTDLPWHWRPGDSPGDVAMVSLHQSPVSDQAIVGSVRGAWRLGLASGQCDPDQLARLAAIADACEGVAYEDLEDRYGRQHADAAAQVVGSFFGKAFRKIKKLGGKLIKPLAKGALAFVPGGGLASLALDAASSGHKRHVAHAQHLPPEQRAAALVIPSRSHAAPPPQELPGAVRMVDREPNVQLLTTFADRLQRAYEFSSSHNASRAVARPAPPARGSGRQNYPPAAWPR